MTKVCLGTELGGLGNGLDSLECLSRAKLRFGKGLEDLAKAKVRLGKGLQGLGRARLERAISARDWGIGRTKVRLNKALEGLHNGSSWHWTVKIV